MFATITRSTLKALRQFPYCIMIYEQRRGGMALSTLRVGVAELSELLGDNLYPKVRDYLRKHPKDSVDVILKAELTYKSSNHRAPTRETSKG